MQQRVDATCQGANGIATTVPPNKIDPTLSLDSDFLPRHHCCGGLTSRMTAPYSSLRIKSEYFSGGLFSGVLTLE